MDRVGLETFVRLLPRGLREFRRRFLIRWTKILIETQRQTKYQIGDKALHVQIVSPPRLRARSRETVSSLEEQNVSWSFHNSTDGLFELNMFDVRKYAGRKKRKRMIATAHFQTSQLIQLKLDYDDSKQVSKRYKESLHERLRFGCYMSHVSLWLEALREGVPFAIVLEDDAIIATNFTGEVTARLERLPVDWDLLYLNGCYKRLGLAYDAGLRQSHGGLCTIDTSYPPKELDF